MGWFKKRDPIEEEWKQEEQIAYKSSLHRARVKEAEEAGKRQAKESYSKPKTSGFGAFMGKLQKSASQAFGSPKQKPIPTKKVIVQNIPEKIVAETETGGLKIIDTRKQRGNFRIF